MSIIISCNRSILINSVSFRVQFNCPLVFIFIKDQLHTDIQRLFQTLAPGAGYGIGSSLSQKRPLGIGIGAGPKDRKIIFLYGQLVG
jgi:hypothetical protein